MLLDQLFSVPTFCAVSVALTLATPPTVTAEELNLHYRRTMPIRLLDRFGKTHAM